MATQVYSTNRRFTKFFNQSATKLPDVAGAEIRLFYKDGHQEAVEFLAGETYMFENLDTFVMDTVDYGNCTVSGFDRLHSFFPKSI